MALHASRSRWDRFHSQYLSHVTYFCYKADIVIPKMAQIGVVLSTVGIMATFINLIVFPPLQRRVGTIAIYRGTIVLLVVLAALFPLITRIAATEVIHHPIEPGPLTRISVGALIIVKAISGMVFA